ncbi:MAG TPA: class I adenylate-forming enzyme family protein, partial [Sphingomicrobium sp.]|nr:class I adenylate-forming enzyme family protein [Sphingomicrobium sp.]
HPPERVAVRVGGLDISYGRLIADVMAAAVTLAAKGVAAGSKVGIRAGSVSNGHSYANWVAHLATLHLGAGHVSIVESASVAAAVQAGLIDMAIGARQSLNYIPAAIKRVEFDCDPAKPLVAPTRPAPGNEAAAARINLTSGTTGKPKFLVWDHAMIEARVAQVGDGVPLGPDTILYPLLHIRTTAGFRYPLAVWRAGGIVLLPDNAEPRERDQAALGVSTLIAASPVQLGERIRLFPDPWDGRAGRTIIVLGGRLPGAVRDAALDRACGRLLISYGSTETGSVALGDSACIDRHAGAVGFVRDGVAVEIVGPDKRPVAAGDLGLVRVKTGLMCDGYHAAVPGIESSHFEGGYFYPGDSGRLFDDGLLAIEGRLTDTINVGGWKVDAVDLEARLAFLPGVDDLCACVMPLAEGDLLTIAVVTRDKVDLNAVAERIRGKLPRGRTFHLVRIKAIPRNAMGKIPRALIANKLTELYGASRQNLSKNNSNA